MRLADGLTGLNQRLRFRNVGRTRERRGKSLRYFTAEVSQLEIRTLLSSDVLGPETRINSTVAGIQQFSVQSDKSVAVDVHGNIIATWTSPNANGRGSEIVARRVDAEGNPLGAEFVVNTTTTSLNRNPVVAASDDDKFVVAWEARGNSQDQSGWGVYARVYSNDGTALTDEILVNASTTGNQRDPSVDWLTSDSFVVSWSGAGQGMQQTAFSRIFQSSGTPLTGETRLSGFAKGGQRDVAVVALPGGDFQAVWQGQGAGDSNGIFSRQFDALGHPLGREFRVNTARRAREQQPALAVVDDQVVISWQSINNRLDRLGTGVIARRFDLKGAPLGPEFRINQTTAGNQFDPSIAPLVDGGFVAAWEGAGVGDNHGVFVREFNADGTPRSAEQRANTTVAGIQAHPTVQATGTGYVVAWDGMIGAGESGADSAADPRGIAMRATQATQWAMPESSVATRDDVMTFTIPGIGVVQQVSPKTITFTNTTDKTIYPILESANNNAVPNNNNGHSGLGLYDPYDAVNLEYRGYIGYTENGQYYLGLKAGQTVTVPVPLVFWDAGRILIAPDGANLIPQVDNVVPPANTPNSPNPFHFHDFQNFIITDGVLQDLVSKDGVPQSVADALKPLLNQTFVDIDKFKNAARTAVGPAAYGTYEVPILNRASSVIPTKRYRDDLADGVHAVLWYRAQGVGGLAEGPAGSAPAQLGEMTFRSKIFADPRYVTHKDIDPNGKSGEVHDLVNYDVSYVDSMTLPVAMQANNVPLDPSGKLTTATAPFGWVGADKSIAQLQGPLDVFTSPNPDRNTNANGLGNYFGGQGYPKYYIPSATEALTGIKVPAGQNLALESPVTNGRSSWDQNRFILTSAGSDPIVYAQPGAISSQGNTIYFDKSYLQDLTIVKQAVDAKKPVLVDASLNNFKPGTKVTGVDLSPDSQQRLTVTVDQSDVNPSGTPGGVYNFVRPVEDYVMTKLANLWFSWADHYYDQYKDVTPDSSYSGKINAGSNELVLTAPVAASHLVVGMPVSGPGMPAGYLATIIGLVYADAAQTQVKSIKLSKLSDAGGSGADYLVSRVQQIRPQNTVGFPITPYKLSFTDPTDPDYDLRFARSIYVVMDSMNTIPVSSPTDPAIISLMANVIGGNIGFIPHIGVSTDPSKPSNYSGVLLVADVIRDSLKSVLRGVDDFQTDTEAMGHWYPDPSLTGDVTGQKINGTNADFNVYNLNPFVWFVHKKLGLSGYGFSLDDDAADVGADGASELRVVIGSIDNLSHDQFYKAEWTHGAPYGPVKSTTGSLSIVNGGQYDGKYQLTGLDMSPLPVVLQVLGTGSSGEAGALVSGPGIQPGTKVLFANIGGNGVILDKVATIPASPSGPYFFSGTPPKVATPASATPAGANSWNLRVLGADGFYGEPSLSYTWSLLSGPSGVNATFASNGSNAAKNTEVTLTNVPGKYVFQVTISEPNDVGGFFTTTGVAVVVPNGPRARVAARSRRN
ncbi:hypothetical protein SAMN05444166_7531 [Singulisphaera sp. GP187]|uniref:hypothetical protein n=1 Tax=Singulisphaera sp. GP187 TaxID=1882752 RepID=UPI0009276B92|nr:hypothetical protein [Singulisphaera sp. GP187]SIO65013.1 hypothetical protein SAMN05444166_7531 [Singulisphaera sp. GP187]